MSITSDYVNSKILVCFSGHCWVSNECQCSFSWSQVKREPI